jgi:DNA-binding SARP family transcriptional activator
LEVEVAIVRHDDMIRVLGPIDLMTREGAKPVGSGTSRRLLAALVLGAGRAVSNDRLQWTLWEDHPPPSAANSLQTYVSRLRHVLGTDTIVRRDHSYLLDVTRDQIDATRFEDLLIAATQLDDHEQRRRACREALALWHGDPFGDFVDDEPFRLEAIRLNELRLTIIELELESELELGHPQIVAAELESAIQEHPYRERLWHLLMEALLRDERRVDALRIGHELRHRLATAGLDPSPEIDELERRILHHTPPG